LKELKLRFGEAVDYAEANSPIEGFGGVRGADSKVDDIYRDVDQGMDDCLWRKSEPQTAIKLPSIHPKIPLLSTTEPQGPFLILLILLGVVGFRFLALCQGQITNRLLYH